MQMQYQCLNNFTILLYCTNTFIYYIVSRIAQRLFTLIMRFVAQFYRQNEWNVFRAPHRNSLYWDCVLSSDNAPVTGYVLGRMSDKDFTYDADSLEQFLEQNIEKFL